MTKTVQRVGGSKANQDKYIGAPRELTIDTSNHEVRVHDGVTQGGHVLLGLESAGQMFQEKSTELSGLTSFDPELKGLLTRINANLYAIRQVLGKEGEIVVENPRGTMGDIRVGLPDTITKDLTIVGETRIEGDTHIEGITTGAFIGEFMGPLAGDTEGTHYGDVEGNAHGDHTGTFTGSADFRNGAVQFANGQIPVSAISGLESWVQVNAHPWNVVYMYKGHVADIPTGFALCDGNNGTPDLTRSFIRGADGVTIPIGQTGGSDTHTHTADIESSGAHGHAVTVHPHALTVAQLPSHNHGGGIALSSSDLPAATRGTQPFAHPNSISLGGSNAGVAEQLTQGRGDSQAHEHTGSVSGTDGAHTHGVDVSSASTLPTYYAMAFITRI